ncbi:MAG: hypothetical protein N2662_04130 [Bacteroidales bacterium]|nr:hypothetical protein [Bacteroidales bacterium]
MRKRILSLMTFLLLSGLFVEAQDVANLWKNNFILESEMIYPRVTLYDDIAIRQNPMSDSWSSHDDGSVSLSSMGAMLGTRWKFSNTTSNFSFSFGVRFRVFFNEITGKSTRNADYYYLRYYSNNDVTKFARTKLIDEGLWLLSIPVEMHYVFWKHEFFDVFTTLGFEGGYIMNRYLDITFRDQSMDIYKNEVTLLLKHPTNSLFGSAYGTMGIQIGNSRNIVFELCPVGLFFSSKYFYLSTSSQYSSVRFSIHLPISKTQQP